MIEHDARSVRPGFAVAYHHPRICPTRRPVGFLAAMAAETVDEPSDADRSLPRAEHAGEPLA